jgi:phosphatidylglycerophosphate synthase
MLDGMVALAAGSANARGEIFNDLPDRVSDVLIFVGAAHSGWMHLLPGYWAAIMSLGTAYVGILGQAVGTRRQFGGLMSKPWRMVVLTIGAWVTFLLWSLNRQPHFFGLTILDLACLVVVAGCCQTCVHRLRRILPELRSPNE